MFKNEIENIETMMSEILKIKNKYTEEYKRSGVEYNIFKVIRKPSDEVHLHTKIIADLLNPKSSHGLKTLPLKLFFENCLNNRNLEVKADDKFTVSAEKSVGDLGRIDILIACERFCIAIENKFNAMDQPSQLWRYYQYLENEKQQKNKKFQTHLIYLTIDGCEAKDESLNPPPKEKGVPLKHYNYGRISYEANIINWLEQLVLELEKEESKKIWVLEPLKQYINLIKGEVGISLSKDEDDEILGVIKKKENLKSALEIYKSFPMAMESIRKDIFKSLKEKLKSKSKMVVHDAIDEESNENNGCYVEIGKYHCGIWWDDNFGYNLYNGVDAERGNLKIIQKILSDFDCIMVPNCSTLAIKNKNKNKKNFNYKLDKSNYKIFLECLENPSVFDPFIEELMCIIERVAENQKL